MYCHCQLAGMCPKTGEFTCPEPGLYLILATCCTFDMKKCLVSIRKNGKDAANIFDQDGDQNKVRTTKHDEAKFK